MSQGDLFPLGENFTQNELEHKFVLVKDEPYENPELAYKILIPKTFTPEPIKAETPELNPNTLKPLGIFKGPAENGVNPFIQIQAVQLVKEITAANWLRHYAIITNRHIDTVKPINTNLADSVMEFNIEGHLFFARITASIDGDRLFFLLNLAHESMYSSYKNIFGVSVVSFNIENRSPKPSIEKHVPYKLSEMINFKYPESWQYILLTDAPPGKSGVDLFNHDPDGNICGKIRVKTVKKKVSSRIDTQIEDTLEEYRESNVKCGELIECIDVEIGTERFESAIINVYRGEIKGNDISQEIWIAVIEDPEYFFVVTLLTPFREQAFFIWAINHRAFNIVLETLA